MKLFANLAVFTALSLTVGLGSAWYAVTRGVAPITAQAGPWVTWVNAGRLDADPYSRAHMARSGRLPITAANAAYFTATTDDDGNRLTVDCVYDIVIRPIPALWWGVTLYDDDGRLIANKAQRHAFNSKNLALLPDGTHRIALSPTARPGNWLPSGDGDGLMLVLRIVRPLNPEQDGQEGVLPQIRKVECP